MLRGLGSTAAGVLTEKLGNRGLFKSACGSGWLDDASLSTLGRLAYSAENGLPRQPSVAGAVGKRRGNGAVRNLAAGGGERSAVCSDEGTEEFAEGVVQPLLKRLF